MRIILRIRTAPEKRIVRSRRPNRRLAWLGASLLWPAGVCCFLICSWRWAFDLSWVSRFLEADGIFSHWQPWFVVGGLAQVLAVQLTRYAEMDRGTSLVERGFRQPRADS